jgi:predicted  nucleic acid-binding Zn-ribbon protein
MSVLAKVFVIINLVFSIAFLTVSGALYHHKMNWREQFLNLQNNYKNLKERDKGEIDKLNHTISDYNDYIQQRETKIVELQQRIDEEGQKYRDSRMNLALETQEMTLLLADHSRTIIILTRLDDELKGLKTLCNYLQDMFNKAMAQKNTAENQVTRLTNIKLDLEKDLSDLGKSNTKTRKELNDTRLVLQALELFGIPVKKIALLAPPPSIEAVVLAYDEPTRLVVLSVGRKNEVVEGYQFTVWRGSRFVARIQVTEVRPDWSACRVMFEATGEKIQKGDLAATRLP